MLFFFTMLKSFKAAFRGLYIAFKSERNLKIHIVIATLALVLARYLQLARFEMSLIIMAISLVLIAEMMNTAIEKICNKIEPNFNNHIRDIKDISAAAVLIAAFAALVIGAYVFTPHIMSIMAAS